MYRVEEWLQLHDCSADVVADTISIEINAIRSDLAACTGDPVSGARARSFAVGDQKTVYDTIVVPALIAFFPAGERVGAALRETALATEPSPSAAQARTIDRGPGIPPLISMPWGGQAVDLLTLAHEAGHALQLSLSAGSFMPPVAREVCAFLAERIVMDWLEPRDPELWRALSQAWCEDQDVYLGDDLAVLAEALKDLSKPYEYRLNYPLARLAAQRLFPALTSKDALALFSSGAQGATWITRETGWNTRRPAECPLPPMPAPATPQHAAYASLGAIVVLDLEDWQREADRSIETYYETRLDAMQSGAAFVGLDDEKRPRGAALWSDEGEAHIATPFGQRAEFRAQLAAHRAPERRAL